MIMTNATESANVTIAVDAHGPMLWADRRYPVAWLAVGTDGQAYMVPIVGEGGWRARTRYALPEQLRFAERLTGPVARVCAGATGGFAREEAAEPEPPSLGPVAVAELLGVTRAHVHSMSVRHGIGAATGPKGARSYTRLDMERLRALIPSAKPASSPATT